MAVYDIGTNRFIPFTRGQGDPGLNINGLRNWLNNPVWELPTTLPNMASIGNNMELWRSRWDSGYYTPSSGGGGGGGDGVGGGDGGNGE